MSWPWRVLQGMKNIKEASEAGVAEAGGTAMELVIRDASGTWKPGVRRVARLAGGT